MKQLLAGIVFLLVLGVGGFLYRNTLEHPSGPKGTRSVACTTEAKLCPDGTSVGRTGPACEFTICSLPNAQDSKLGISFVIPAGYVANADAVGADETLRAVFDKPSKGSVPHSVIIRVYPILEGKTGASVIVAHTMFEPSGNSLASTSELKTKTIGTHTYYSAVLERFEGQVHSAYYLIRAHDVLKFEILEKDVDWTNSKLVIETLPEHKALLQLLGTLQTP